MEELKAAVLELQSQLEAYRANTDPSKTNMLKARCVHAVGKRGGERECGARGGGQGSMHAWK